VRSKISSAAEMEKNRSAVRSERVFTMIRNRRSRSAGIQNPANPRFRRSLKKCSRSAGISVHVAPESAFTMIRNWCSRCAGIGVHDDAEYAFLAERSNFLSPTRYGVHGRETPIVNTVLFTRIQKIFRLQGRTAGSPRFRRAFVRLASHTNLHSSI
jgi:hypothetical protein